MLAAAGEVAAREGLALGLLATVFLAGLRHGFDIDHVAAISDITSSQTSRKRSLLLATTYALGHMLVLFALGVIAVLAGRRLSSTIDSVAGRVIGLTLVMLGLYVVYSLVRYRRDFRMKSRWMLLIAGIQSMVHRIKPPGPLVVIEHEHEHEHGEHHDHSHPGEHIGPAHPTGTSSAEEPRIATLQDTITHEHRHSHVVTMPSDPFTDYGVRTSFLIGMIHGVGAETPTQVLLFTSAAGVAGTFGGLALVGTFVVGLLIGNSILAVVTSVGFATGKKLPLVYMGFAAVAAIVSIYVGTAYLLDRHEILPPLLGG